MLKAVVEEMQLRSEFCFSTEACLVAVFSNDDRRLEFARYEQRFIAELLRQARGIDKAHAPGAAPVAARKDIELDSTRLEQLAQQNHERSFSGATCRKIAHADDRAPQPP